MLSSPRSSGGGSSGAVLPLQSPATLPLEITAPPRIVQKQVISIRAHADGCTAVLYLRLALPTSSKSRSFPLFPDEGVKLKSSIVYPVSLEKGNRIVIPQDASKGLKRAARILGLITTGGTAVDGRQTQEEGRDHRMPSIDEEKATENESSSHKQVKPRITSSQFHITIVCPPSRETPVQESNAKTHFIAVVQTDLTFALSPPMWPFEARIPIPRCLNNKLHFTSEEQEENPEGDFTVEFDPPLVHRPRQSRSSSGIGSLFFNSAEGSDNLDRKLEDEEGEGEGDASITGPFPATDAMVVRWAKSSPMISRSSKEAMVDADRLITEVHVLNVRRPVDEPYALMSLRIQLSLRKAFYPALDHTASLKLDLILSNGEEVQWVADSLVVHSERSRTLQSWSVSGREVSLMSRSSSANLLSSTSSTNFGPSNSGTLVDEKDSALDEEGNLIDILPPKGVVDVSMDLSEDVSTSALLSPTSTVHERNRKVSLNSTKSEASAYSQHSAHADGDSIQLLLRTSSLREAFAEGTELTFSIQGSMRCPIVKTNEESGELHFACPALRSTHIATDATLCSITNDIRIRSVEDGRIVESAQICKESDGKLSATYALVKTLSEESDASPETSGIVGDLSGTTTATAVPSNVTPHNGALRLATANLTHSDESMEVLSFPLQPVLQDKFGTDVEDWSGIIDHAKVSSWVSNVEGYTGNSSTVARRKLVTRIDMTWPRCWPQKEDSTDEQGIGSKLLPRLVFALPSPSTSPSRDSITILHASVLGRPILAKASSPDLGHEGVRSASSKIIDLRLPKELDPEFAQPVKVTLMYSIQLPAQGSFCLFPPTASTVAYLEADVVDEGIQDQVPVVSYTNDPSLSSLRKDERPFKVHLDACMLLDMTTVTLAYIQRTKPLIPIATPVTPPTVLRRQSANVTLRRETSPLPNLDSIPARPPSPSTKAAVAIAKRLTSSPKRNGLATQRELHLPVLDPMIILHTAITTILALYLYRAICSTDRLSERMDGLTSGLQRSVDSAVEAGLLRPMGSDIFVVKPPIDSIKALAPLQEQSMSLFRSSGHLDVFTRWMVSILSLPLRFFTTLFGVV